MSYWAKINDGVVEQVIAKDEQPTGGEWVETSYDGSFRKRYAFIGGTYDPVNDVFINKQPFPSWVLNGDFEWGPPVPMPDDFDVRTRFYYWDEVNKVWIPPEDVEG